MKVAFPIGTVVKQGGSGNVLKLYLPNKNDHWISEIDSNNIILHLGELSICSPTHGEWLTYHSFNNSSLSDWLKVNKFSIDDALSFIGIEDMYGKFHLVLISANNELK